MSKGDPLLPYKGSIIKEMYLHTADENYVVARWAHDNRLYTDFFWNSVHALEKYMKAVLLFNGHPVKGHSHGLTGLYAEVVKVAGKLMPPLLTRPANLDIHHWVDLKPEEFLERLDGNGNADNRYLTYGYAQHAWYVHMVDTMVWSIRRLALPLDDPIVPRSQLATAPTHREVLERQPAYSNHLSLPLEQIIGGGDSDARRALLNNNCAFAPDDFVHEPRASGTAGRNPVLLRRILHPLRSDQADGAPRIRAGQLAAIEHEAVEARPRGDPGRNEGRTGEAPRHRQAETLTEKGTSEGTFVGDASPTQWDTRSRGGRDVSTVDANHLR